MKKKMKMGGAAPKKAMMGNTMMASPMMKMGGSLKSVDKGKNPGLAKLPTPVRNKMGYKKHGGDVDMMKAQGGKSVKPTADSTDYFYKKSIKDINNSTKVMKEKGYFKDGKVNDETKKAFDLGDKSLESLKRQSKKGKPGYDANGFPLKKMLTKMQAGGVVKTQPKRMGPIDPNGAYTKVQERTLAGKKVAAPKLVKDKELGATKMKKGGKVSKKK